MTMTRTLPLIVSTLGLALTACGGNGNHEPAPDAAPAGPPRAVVVSGDFGPGHPGVLSTLDPATLAVTMNAGPAMAVGDDPILRHFGGELFIVNRSDGNNITILDDQTLALKEQLGTGASSNPQDVAVHGNTLYVATFGGKGLVMLTRGQATVTTIDLSQEDPDGKPNCNSVYLAGSDLFVSCGLLDDTNKFVPRGPGKVYVIDTATNTIKTTLTLSTNNPFGVFEQIPAGAPNNAGDLLMPTVLFPVPPSTALPTGCVERIATGATPAAAGCVPMMNNTDLMGYASRIAFLIDKVDAVAITWIATPTTFPKSDLRAYDMPTSALWAGPLNPSTEAISDLAVCPHGELVVADTTMDANGLRVYNSGAAEVTKAALPIGLPPNSTHGIVCY
jgi:hypothetical protein